MHLSFYVVRTNFHSVFSAEILNFYKQIIHKRLNSSTDRQNIYYIHERIHISYFSWRQKKQGQSASRAFLSLKRIFTEFVVKSARSKMTINDFILNELDLLNCTLMSRIFPAYNVIACAFLCSINVRLRQIILIFTSEQYISGKGWVACE